MLAANNPVGYDLGVIALLFDRYVDDINSGADTKEAREEMIRQVEEILSKEDSSLSLWQDLEKHRVRKQHQMV